MVDAQRKGAASRVRDRFGVVAMAASAGGLHALTIVLEGLPADLPVPTVVVQHLDPAHRSMMAEILTSHTKLRVKQAEEGERLVPGTVFMAPPNRHLLVCANDTLSLSQAERVAFSRPSADILFRSVASVYGPRAIGVVLSGTGRDGSAGLKAIEESGGTAVVQSVQSAEFSGMPQAAIDAVDPDLVIDLNQIGTTLIRLIMEGVCDESC